MKQIINTANATETEVLAENIGRRLKGGEVIELIGDLGSGKTTFTRGLAKAIGSNDRVASPTFTISKLYKGDKLEINHFDFYRLSDAGVIEHEIHDLIGDPASVLVIEWGDILARVLPSQRLTVTIKLTGEEGRAFELSHPDSLGYLTKGLSYDTDD